jgi:hypothetical protein
MLTSVSFNNSSTTFFFFCSPGVWTRPHACYAVALTLWPLHQPFFCVEYFGDGILQTISLGWLQVMILLIFTSGVARIIDMSHWLPALCILYACFWLFETRSCYVSQAGPQFAILLCQLPAWITESCAAMSSHLCFHDLICLHIMLLCPNFVLPMWLHWMSYLILILFVFEDRMPVDQKFLFRWASWNQLSLGWLLEWPQTTFNSIIIPSVC